MNVPCFQPQVRQNTRIGSTCTMLLTNLLNRQALMFFFLQRKDLADALDLSADEWMFSAEMEGTLRRSGVSTSYCIILIFMV